MDVGSRINARKVVFIYFFQKYFVNFFLKDFFSEKRKNLTKDLGMFLASEEDYIEIRNLATDYYEWDCESDINYIIEKFFSNKKNKMDYEYIYKLCTKFNNYKDEVEHSVDSHVSTFYYQEMDVIDRVIFLLWYVEYKEISTDKKVILNEMIEIAKRYWDSSSKKLINGIWDKIIN